MIPSIQWHLLYKTFADFASMARQYHFYEPEITRMEQSLFDMSPYKNGRKDDNHEAGNTR